MAAAAANLYEDFVVREQLRLSSLRTLRTNLSISESLVQKSTDLPPTPPSRARLMSHHSENISQKDDNDKEVSEIKISEEIGSGRFGVVYKATFARMECAIKVLRHVGAEEKPRPYKKLSAECDHLRKLVHPNVVRFLGMYYHDQQQLPMMVMELMDESLTTYIEKSDIRINTKLSLLHDVATGLHFLHTRSVPVVHGDLSPNNILLKFIGNGGTLPIGKIADLGLAKFIYNKPRSIEFLAPEAFPEKPKYDTPIDVFSFGGVIVFTINEEWPTPVNPEKQPTTKISKFECRQKYLNMMETKVPALTELMPLIEACLSNEPARRPSVAVILEKIELELAQLNNAQRRNIDDLLSEAETSIAHSSHVEDFTASRLPSKKDEEGKELESHLIKTQKENTGLQFSVPGKPNQQQKIQQDIKVLLEEFSPTKSENSSTESDNLSTSLPENSLCKGQFDNEEEVERVFSLALRDGEAQLSSFRIYMVGKEGAGKTCLASLLGHNFKKNQRIRGPDIEVSTIFDSNWSQVKNKGNPKQLQKRFYCKLKDYSIPQKQAEINHVDNYRETNNRHIEIVDHLLPEVTTNNDHQTPLHCATRWGQTDTVKILIENGADVNAKDKDNKTPLVLALEFGLENDFENGDVVKILLENGAEVDVKDGDHQTPLHCAARWGQTDTVKILIENGADVNAKDKDNKTPLVLALEFGLENDFENGDIVKILLENGAEVDVKDGHCSLRNSMQFTLSFHGIEDAGKTALLNRLVNLKSCEDKSNSTAFHYATRHASVNLAVITNGAKVNTIDTEAEFRKGIGCGASVIKFYHKIDRNEIEIPTAKTIQFVGNCTRIDRVINLQLPVMAMGKMGFGSRVVNVNDEITICDQGLKIAPVIHRDLSPNNVLLTAHFVAKISDLGMAKISDLGVAKIINPNKMGKASGTVAFMAPEVLPNIINSPGYLDVFSFSTIMFHRLQQMEQVQFDPKTRKRIALSEIELCQQFLDKITGEAEVFRGLVKKCLVQDFSVAEWIQEVNRCLGAYMMVYPQDCLFAIQQNKKLGNENQQKDFINNVLSKKMIIGHSCMNKAKLCHKVKKESRKFPGK